MAGGVLLPMAKPGQSSSPQAHEAIGEHKEASMKLKRFRIQNYRSISDSGPINVDRLAALVGRNESGKSNLLRALYSLNPADGFRSLNKIKDFPRDRRLEECIENTPVVATLWELSDDDRAELSEIWPRAGKAKGVQICSTYGNERTSDFQGMPDEDADAVKPRIQQVALSLKSAADDLEEAVRDKLVAAADRFERDISGSIKESGWARDAKAALDQLCGSLNTADINLVEAGNGNLAELHELAEAVGKEADGPKAAHDWAINKMSVFVYLDQYPYVNGNQNIADFVHRRDVGQQTGEDRNFEKMCKVAGLRLDELKGLLNQDNNETRNQLANRASAVVTREIRRLWKDRLLKVRFDTDGDYINTLVSDPNATFDVEVNLNERSRGFQWFFSFYVTFSADTNGGAAEDAILLLDEPGLHLHAKSQRDLLNHFETDFGNQILYTTHSPFMVPTHRLNDIRTVNIAEDHGTTVSNNPTGDARTLFPLQAALGYDLAQSLFVGPHNLVVEGVTDYWLLSSVSEYLNADSARGLRQDITITPAGGAQKVHYMVALLSSEQLNVLALLDDEQDSRATRDDLVKSKLINEKNVIFVSDAFASQPPKEADIEDLLDPKTYEDLVRESYSKELEGVSLKVNNNIPRIAPRFEDAFATAGLVFHKTRPMRLLLTKMGNDPAEIVTDEVAARFTRLASTINDRIGNRSGN